MDTTELQLFDATVGLKSKENSTRYEQPVMAKPYHDYLNQTLQSIFPTNAEEQRLLSARNELGLSIAEYPDERLVSLLADFEYLANTWLDLFEREQLDGKTLNELLKK